MRERIRIKNFTGVYAFYLMRELRKRGIQLHFIDPKPPNPIEYFAHNAEIPECDHCLVLGLRHLTHLPVGCARALKGRVKGAVTQIHDGLIHEGLAAWMDGIDCTFTFRDDSRRTKDWHRYADRYCYIGWAADPDLFFPAQLQGELRILIDHPFYKSGKPDYTAGITEQAMLFAHSRTWTERFKSVRVRRLVNGGAEDVTMENIATRQFDREHIALELIAPEYRRAYIYLPTHKESVGLTCLETAMCGALVVAPAGFIYQDRLDCVRHVGYEEHIPWRTAMAACDYAGSRAKALQQTWPDVAARMLHWFECWR
jgi:hypothetical protein